MSIVQYALEPEQTPIFRFGASGHITIHQWSIPQQPQDAK